MQNTSRASNNMATPSQDTKWARTATAARWVVLASLAYQALLCLVHSNLHAVSTAVVVASEGIIFLACALMLSTRCSLSFIALTAASFAYLLLFALFRESLDVKSFRDILIPLFFFELGRQYGDEQSADRLINVAIVVVLVCALFELLFLDQYSKVFNIYSYYVSQGNILPGTAWAADSALSLNGVRPEGIGRTILPALLGNHRVSSIFLEPVSLGNFSIIVSCWALSKPVAEYKRSLALLLASVILIALSDSRYGLLTLCILLLARFLLPRKAEAAMVFLPLACIAIMIGIADSPGLLYTDDFLGRLFLSGRALLDTDLNSFFALGGSEINMGDMGYPAMLLHLGFPICALLWGAFWLVRMKDDSGRHLRVYAAIYISLILCVSGSSMFALKSAGLLWFLLGCRALIKDVSVRSELHMERDSYAH